MNRLSRAKKLWRRLGRFWRPQFDTHEPTHGASASVDAYFNFLAYHFFVPITIEFPDLALQTGFNLTRWTEILADPSLAKVPDRIETDRHGHILMTPPPGLRHSERQGQIIGQLIQFAPLGRTLPECPISTADGVKAIDVGWLDAGRNEIGRDIPLLMRAPEICIEILSPSNSAAEIAEKRLLYFDAEATEVWICNRDGSFAFFSAADRQIPRSIICPPFPERIS
jgi:Uma2 family endonuclease